VPVKINTPFLFLFLAIEIVSLRTYVAFSLLIIEFVIPISKVGIIYLSSNNFFVN
jgi:hypothetical protein